ncbi:MAG: ATP-grasp domain-containing protein [Planctomycetes bacterium]|nr:ATP-grasp domain-containing protein [Planctomycetota bacterium]
MNVLLTCAGRRNYLVRYFQAALHGSGEVIACDSSESAPAFTEADRSFVVPPADHPDYWDILEAICDEQQVRLLIPVHDLELAGLARRIDRFHAVGTVPMISAPEVIATCQDKWASFRFLRSHAIATPETFRSIDELRRGLAQGAIGFPLLIKPRWGTTSFGIERIDNEHELGLAYQWGQVQLRRGILAKLAQAAPADCFVFQQYVEGDEYGLDVVNDMDGDYAGSLARRKLAIRAGNTDRAITVCDPELERVGRTIGRALGHVGILDSDLIRTKEGYQVLDLNARFGGGYPFSHTAGADVPAALIAWVNGAAHDPAWLQCRTGVLSAKFDEIADVDPNVPFVAERRELAEHV